jgi:uncharacterized protein (TIGR00251 family)
MRVLVHATPGAKRNHVGGSHDGALRVSVTAPADKGKANQAIAKLLAKAIGVKSSQVNLISGQSNRRKVFEVEEDLSAKLAELMNL